MNRYYTNNALYERLEKTGGHNFCWASGNSWILLYGDTSGNPRLIIFAAGKSIRTLDDTGKERLKTAFSAARELAKCASLPFGVIEFDDRVEEISQVSLNNKVVSLDKLKAWFSTFGLTDNGDGGHTPLKSINDTASSAYHNWQRSALGRITVTDIDMLRFDTKTGAPASIYELKRSFISLEEWAPFRDDYPNYNILSTLATMARVEFRVVYNVRHTQPQFFDDVSRLHIFSYSRQTGPSSLSVVSFDDFVQEAQ